MIVNFHIDRLVMEGLSIPYHRESLLQATIKTELQRLFTINGLSRRLQSNGAISQISGNDIQLTDNGEIDTAYLGQQIAQAVYEGVNR